MPGYGKVTSRVCVVQHVYNVCIQCLSVFVCYLSVSALFIYYLRCYLHVFGMLGTNNIRFLRYFPKSNACRILLRSSYRSSCSFMVKHENHFSHEATNSITLLHSFLNNTLPACVCLISCSKDYVFSTSLYTEISRWNYSVHAKIITVFVC